MSGACTVLIVDDEPEAVLLAGKVLEELGDVTVLSASGGASGIEQTVADLRKRFSYHTGLWHCFWSGQARFLSGNVHRICVGSTML
jgi:hypothetical protein